MIFLRTRVRAIFFFFKKRIFYLKTADCSDYGQIVKTQLPTIGSVGKKTTEKRKKEERKEIM